MTKMTPLLENGTILFNPDLAPEHNEKEHNDLMGELLGFPLARHDDQVDALVHGVDMASQYLLKHSKKRGGVKVHGVSSKRKKKKSRHRDIFDGAESWATLDE